MTPHETAAPVVAKPAGWTRRRKIMAAIVVGLVGVGAATTAFWYFTRCGDCGRSPILCTDPCVLPTFGQIPDGLQGTRVLAAVTSPAANR